MKKLLIAILLFCPINFAYAKATINGELVKIDVDGAKHIMRIKLSDAVDNSPITLDQLKEVHTEKIHLLIVDDSLDDYSHIHPTPTDIAGEYQFDWFPKNMAKYKIWADVVPLKSDTQEYVVMELKNKAAKKPSITRTTPTDIKMNDMNFKVAFDGKLKAGNETMINVSVTDKDGQPYDNLEQIMGAFAHLVAFSEDFKTIAHIHPMGIEPEWPWQTGGPNLSFHFSPTKKGFYKFFLQTKIDGNEVFVPFGVVVR